MSDRAPSTAAAAGPPTASRWFLICLAVGYLFFGTVQTLSLKWADSLSASDGHSFTRSVLSGFPFLGSAGSVRPENTSSEALMAMEVTPLYSFAHPFTQAFFMFCSEAVCLVFFFGNIVYRRLYASTAHHRRGDDPGEEAKPVLEVGKDIALPLNPCVFLLSCGADFLASSIQNVGIMLTYASVYQMLRGATVVWIAVISYVWLHRRFTKVECWGMGSVVLGLTLVGLSTVRKSKDSAVHAESSATEAAKNPLLGNLLVISAQVLHAYQGVCQERLFRLYKVPPLQMVGTEGVYGVALTLSLLAFLQIVPMSAWGHNLVALQERLVYRPAEVNTPAGTLSALVGGEVLLSHNTSWIAKGLVEAGSRVRVPYDDVVLAFAQMSTSFYCLASILLYIPAGFFYNACQLTIIKHLSATATVMLGSLRNITVWMACLLIPAVFGETFSVVQFIGFVFLVLGNILFQRVWIATFSEVLPASWLAACPSLFVDRAEEDGEAAIDIAPEAPRTPSST